LFRGSRSGTAKSQRDGVLSCNQVLCTISSSTWTEFGIQLKIYWFTRKGHTVVGWLVNSSTVWRDRYHHSCRSSETGSSSHHMTNEDEVVC
jgi:hypothetical protein